MKLPIKKKYFDEIKKGKKDFELRDAHITFICEETGEKLTKEIETACVSRGFRNLYPDVLNDEFTLFMKLKKGKWATMTTNCKCGLPFHCERCFYLGIEQGKKDERKRLLKLLEETESCKVLIEELMKDE